MRKSIFQILTVLIGIGLICIFSTPSGAQEIRGHTLTMPYYWTESMLDEEFAYLAMYQFAEVGAYDIGTTGMDFYFSGWGRWDTMDKLDPEDEAVGDAELWSAYARWQHEEQYFDFSLGRRLVTMGPVNERIDGFMAQVEPNLGLGIEGFAGVPVISKIGERDGDYAIGARAYGGIQDYIRGGFTLAAFTEKNDPDRIRFGLDLLSMPFEWLDILGHLYADTLYDNVYDGSGSLMVRPVDQMKLLAEYQYFVPSAYLGMGSLFSVFSYETIDKINTLASYVLKNRVVFEADYNHYIYDSIDPANRYGGSIGVLWGENRTNTINLGGFRLDREGNGYAEGRAYFYQSLGRPLFLSLDATYYKLDDKIYGIDQGANGAASFGWHITTDLDLQATGFYAAGPYYEQDYRGLLKLAYRFDRRFGEGQSQ